MPHRLPSISAVALICVGLVDAVQIRAEANLACAYLRDDRTDRSVYVAVDREHVFAWFDAKLEQLSAMFGRFPRRRPFGLYGLADGCFCCRYKGLRSLRGVWSGCISWRLGGLFGRLVRCLITRYSNVGRDPPELDRPSFASKFI